MKRNTYPLQLKNVLTMLLLMIGCGLSHAQFNVSGRLTYGSGQPMTGFAVLATGAENKVAYTDDNGDYTISLQLGGLYEIRPLDCNVQELNGVTTYDRVLVSKHISGIELLDSPYKIMAADVDNSNSVDQTDLNTILNLVSTVIIEFPNGHYRFVQAAYVFPDPFNPFPFPETQVITNLQSDVSNVDFIGVKKGDVNNTAVMANLCESPELPARIRGSVYRDQDENCVFDAGENGMQGWTVEARDGNVSYYGVTNGWGEYDIEVLPGVFQVILKDPTGGLWETCPDTVNNLTVDEQIFGIADFGLRPLALCPAMQVDLSTLGLRRCFPSIYHVQYCNLGTLIAEDAVVTVQLDPYFNFLNSTIPWSGVDGNTYTFPVGDVEPGECGTFTIRFEISCEAELGQTHCTEARVTPDVFCTTPGLWNGAEIKVQGYCAGDMVKFVITNAGSDMIEASNYIVIEDIVVMTPPINNPFTLGSQMSEVITVPANGATWRLEAEQPAGYPWGVVASAVVEGCGVNGTGGFSMGFVNQFPMDDQSPILDIDCRENTGSFDPNDKQGFPVGVLAEHYIPRDQPIEYLIRFQNTGTDTAFTVVIRDTLDAALDPGSIRVLGSSHPHTFQLSGQNALQFVFGNIMLPDSNVNEPASHGFVKFLISPKRGLPDATLVQNSAAIYFDFNEPVITNTTWHTLGEKYLDVSNHIFNPAIGLDVFPNPTVGATTFLLQSATLLRGSMKVYDLNGRVVATQSFNSNQFTFNAENLQAGCYYFLIEEAGLPLAAGKLIKTDR
ncbi:MAG: T9SS type A sorting domain-containing protein [Saprospiraceae bacterium]|nr:T9SS type A sorting domain-containing protein [Saprospiraceae bacterium]